VLAWPSPDLVAYSDCDQVPGSLISHGHCPKGTAYPPALGLTRGQGRHLQSLLEQHRRLPPEGDTSALRLRIVLPRNGGYSNAYGQRSGTSMATPAAAAAAGLIWAAHPECSAAEVREALARGAMDLGPKGKDEYFGHGLVQITPSIYHLNRHPCKSALTTAGEQAGTGGEASGGVSSVAGQVRAHHRQHGLRQLSGRVAF